MIKEIRKNMVLNAMKRIKRMAEDTKITPKDVQKYYSSLIYNLGDPTKVDYDLDYTDPHYINGVNEIKLKNLKNRFNEVVDAVKNYLEIAEPVSDLKAKRKEKQNDALNVIFNSDGEINNTQEALDSALQVFNKYIWSKLTNRATAQNTSGLTESEIAKPISNFTVQNYQANNWAGIALLKVMTDNGNVALANVTGGSQDWFNKFNEINNVAHKQFLTCMKCYVKQNFGQQGADKSAKQEVEQENNKNNQNKSEWEKKRIESAKEYITNSISNILGGSEFKDIAQKMSKDIIEHPEIVNKILDIDTIIDKKRLNNGKISAEDKKRIRELLNDKAKLFLEDANNAQLTDMDKVIFQSALDDLNISSKDLQGKPTKMFNQIFKTLSDEDMASWIQENPNSVDNIVSKLKNQLQNMRYKDIENTTEGRRQDNGQYTTKIEQQNINHEDAMYVANSKNNSHTENIKNQDGDVVGGVVPLMEMVDILERNANWLKYMTTNPPTAKELRSKPWQEKLQTEYKKLIDSSGEYSTTLFNALKKCKKDMLDAKTPQERNNKFQSFQKIYWNIMNRWQGKLEDKPNGIPNGEPTLTPRHTQDEPQGWQHAYDNAGNIAWVDKNGEIQQITNGRGKDMDFIKQQQEIASKNHDMSLAKLLGATDSASKFAKYIMSATDSQMHDVVDTYFSCIPVRIGIGSADENGIMDGDERGKVKTKENYLAYVNTLKEWQKIARDIRNLIGDDNNWWHEILTNPKASKLRAWYEALNKNYLAGIGDDKEYDVYDLDNNKISGHETTNGDKLFSILTDKNQEIEKTTQNGIEGLQQLKELLKDKKDPDHPYIKDKSVTNYRDIPVGVSDATAQGIIDGTIAKVIKKRLIRQGN